MFLVSQSNEKDTDARIEELGARLAQEVREHILLYMNVTNLQNGSKAQVHLSKLTFIGHSLGGIIVREALKHLWPYKNKMHGYISLGSPHLGYMYNSNSLVNAGLWLLKKFKQSDSLK